jgi:PPOX class probable F420-dependent enzyme
MTILTSSTSLTDKARDLLDRRVFASFATLNPDGGPQLSTMWVTRDGDDVLVGTLRGRQKERNLRRDNRVSLMLTDPEDGESYVEIRGTATFTATGARELMDKLSHKYRDKPFPVEPPEKVRVIVRITPTKVIDHD